jgi:NADPH-dependent 2,4-dienoyl-CoA reductase/sulfur reductase-like enzyme
VTVVEAAGLPLQRILGDRIAQVFADLHREHGVAFRFDAKVGGITGEEGSWHVALGNGAGLDADAVLVAVGVAPNTGLAQRAGLKVDNGILVDDRLRSSDPDIFAAGDVANIAHPLLRTRLRVEHWANALNTGPVAARAMLDQEVTYDRLPYFFTDQYDLGMEYSGWVSSVEDTEVVVRGDLERREFVAFWTVDGRVAAGMNVNVWDVNDDVQALIRAGIAGRTVDPARLADAGVPLTEL